ncbi:MAG: Trypsin-like peptidase domain [Pseudomonadota bacterium]
MDQTMYQASETRVRSRRLTQLGFLGLSLVAACSADDDYEATYSQRSATGSECSTGGTVLLVDGEAQVTACNGAPGEMGLSGRDGPPGVRGAPGVVGPSGVDAEDFQSMTEALEPFAESLVGVGCCQTAAPPGLDNPCFSGSGIKTSATRIATARHLVDQTPFCTIFSGTDSALLGTSTAVFPSVTGADAAQIQIDFELDGPVVPSIVAYKPVLGEPVIVVGQPATALGQSVPDAGQSVTQQPVFENQYTFGHVTATSLAATLTAVRGAAIWPNAFSVDAVTWHGNSGGAVFNADGVCIGLLVGGLNGREVNAGPDTSIVLPFPSDS